MDRSQEKVLASQTKLLDQSANIHQKVHENAGIIGVNRAAPRNISAESSIESLPYVDGRNSSDGMNNRKAEPLISPLQAQYFHTVSNSGVPMGLPPYLSTQTMDHRANFFYRYNPQMAVYPSGYPGTYAQRIPNGIEEASAQSSERSDIGAEPKEPVRTESVIKIATERPDSRKQETVDKRQARPTSEDYNRPYQERNGDLEPAARHVTSYRGSRDKSEVTSNGDVRHSSGIERTLSDFRSYQTPPVNSKTMVPVSYGKDYSSPKIDYTRPPPSSQPGMFAAMPRLTPIAPRGHPSASFSSSSLTATDGSNRLSTAGSSVRPTVYQPSRDYQLTTESLVSHRSGDNRPEELNESLRMNYLARSVYENFPAYWEQGDLSQRYPGHSAYQGYGYGRTIHTKRHEDKENVKELEDTRNRTSDSAKESSISPDRSHYSKESVKGSESTTTHRRDQVSSQTYNPAVSSQNDQPSKNQVTLTKKPVLPENVRYKVSDDKKNALKSDKVTVYPKQGMAYVVSVRETPQKVPYFADGRHVDGPDPMDRTQIAGGFEPAVSKKEESQRRDVKDKPTSSDNGDRFTDEYPRRRFDSSTNDRSVSSTFEDSKKTNDRNNNSSLSSCPRYPNQNERSRPANRISLGQDKVFLPPNVNLEMYEKREQEMERAAAACRTADAMRSSELSSRAKVPGKQDNGSDSRYHAPDQANFRPTTNKQEPTNSRSDSSSKSSDDEELKIIEEHVGAQPQARRPEDKRTVSPSRLSRMTSPNTSNVSTANNPPYLTPFGVNFPARITPIESEMVARENAERSMQAAYLYGGNIAFQPNAQFMAPGGRGDMPVMLPVDMFYGNMYKPHVMEPAQGGTVMQDPLTGSLVVVPEALLNPTMFNPLAAAESQLMIDPQLARFWGMQTSMEDPRWQQIHQQQTKQLYEQMEKYKHEMMIAQQQGQWQGYPFYPMYQKQFEVQKKEEEHNSRAEQRPKSREEPVTKQRPEKADETKEKQAGQMNERAVFTHEPRREDLDRKSDNSNRDTKPETSEIHSTLHPEKVASAPVKESTKTTEYPEERSKAKERMQQEEQNRQFQQYMLRDPVFEPPKFPLSRMQASLSKPLYSPTDIPRDLPRDVRDIPRNPSHYIEVTRPEVSPQVVSAAATLANMDLGTRFPFNQQQHGSEQINSVNRRPGTNENVTKGENVTSPRSSTSERTLLDNKMEASCAIASRQISTEIPISPQVNKQTKPTDRHSKDGFDILSLIREQHKPIIFSTNQSNGRSALEDNYRNSNIAESPRLLVARAEKLSQDEELEVIRIDTPYANKADKQKKVSDERTQEMNLLMSLSKDHNGTVESPSSKSEIFWIEGSDGEVDFEVQAINASVRPLKVEFDGNNKENSIMLSLQSSKSEEEKNIIHEKIEKLREIAKGRTREERFTALTRQKELKSPASIVNSVTTSLNEVLDMNVMEKDIRMRLADLQKKYREKHRELTRLQPKCKHGNDDGGKSAPIKRGPGRPRKRKYFGASSKSGKTSPTLTSNDTVENSFKSGGSSPSSCPQSPGLKSITSEDIPMFKDFVVEPVKKKKKKTSVSKKEELQPPSSPNTVSPTTVEVKPRVKTSRRPSSSSSKLKSSNGLSMAATTNSLNIARLISAISPLMFDDNSAMESESAESNSNTSSIANSKAKHVKKAKKIKRENLSSTDETVDPQEGLSADLVTSTYGTPTSGKNNKVKSPKKSKKKAKNPSTPKGKSEFVFPEIVNGGEQKSSSKKKEMGKQMKKEKKAERDVDSSENDEVFTTCLSGGALDMLADFASSASFEKEKQAERESPFEGASLKEIKRGRPKKPSSPAPESDAPKSSKKKRKKKKPLGSKSPKKSSSTSEEKENEVSQPEPAEQMPSLLASPPVENIEVQEPPKPEPLEEQIEKVVKEEEVTEACVEEEEEEEEEEEVVPDTEPEQEITTPSPELIKEKRRKSRTSLAKELDDTKQAFALFGDWQPRRSERIFINSSVTPQSIADLSPLSSPTSKTNEFGWPKKTKKVSKGKKPSKSEDVSDAEPMEEESPTTSTKPLMKTKKKKSPGKGKKRRSSSVTDPDFVLRTPKRKAAKRDRSYEEADEDDDEDMGEEDEDNLEDDGEDKDMNNEHQEDIQEEPTPETNVESPSGDMAPRQEEEQTEPDLQTFKSEQDACKNNESSEDTEISAPCTANEQKENYSKKTDEKASPDIEKESKIEETVEEKDEMTEDSSECHLSDELENKDVTKDVILKSEEQQPITTPLKKEPISKATSSERNTLEEEMMAGVNSDLPPEPIISFTKEELKYNTKMLLPVDRVFFRGRITFYQEPDLYGIILPGERGRRPHLRSTEQLLSQAVKDVIPPAVEYLPVGTRVCAHWSPQYRCFYPGNVIETPPDEKSEVGKLWVEFDDGDSGIFPLSDLRKIITDCPVQVDDVESDVVVPERRRAHFSLRGTSPPSRRSKEQDTSRKIKDDDTSGWDSTEDAPIRRTRARGKRRVKQRTRTLSEEATDSDAPRGSQDTDDEDTTDAVEQSISGNKHESNEKDDDVIDSKRKSSQLKRTKRRSRITREDSKDQEPEESTERMEEETNRCSKEEKKREKVKPSVNKHQEDDSDDDEHAQDPGTIRPRARSSRLSDLDLRKKSLTLNLNSSPRSGVAGSESPVQDSTSQDEDSGSCSEVFDDSPQTESKQFQPRLGKRRRSMLDRLRPDKSAGELWTWSGKNHQNKRKGKGRKVFYKSIVRGDENISVGDCAVFTSNPSKSNNLPYVGKIESMWEGCSGNMVVRVKWFYHPEETKTGRKASDAKHSLYRSTHIDENDVQTISHKCEVVSSEEYKRRTQDIIGTRSATTDRSDRLFTCVGTYDPSTEKIEHKSD